MVSICIFNPATKPAQEKAGPRCHKGFSVASQPKSAKREILQYYLSRQEHLGPANRFRTALYRRSPRSAENIPSISAAESRKYPCTCSGAGERERTLHSSRAGGHRAQVSRRGRENPLLHRRRALAARKHSEHREKSKSPYESSQACDSPAPFRTFPEADQAHCDSHSEQIAGATDALSAREFRFCSDDQLLRPDRSHIWDERSRMPAGVSGQQHNTAPPIRSLPR